MNPHIDQLHSYPFEKLAALKQGIHPEATLAHIALSIGEPQHAAPAFVLAELKAQLSQLSRYPSTRGLPQLRQAIARWLQQRFDLAPDSVDPDTQILPVNGTREALFAIAQAMIDPRSRPVVMMPNPFYQIYEGAALLSGAEPYYLNTTTQTDFLPDFESVPESVWQRCRLIYICSPGNPTGRVIPVPRLQWLIEAAERYDFVIASDECYSEIYMDEHAPPVGLLQAAAQMGNTRFERCVVFHSLSKRSNLPGLRSGFVAGDARILESFSGTGPIMVAPCPCTTSMPVSLHGPMRRMSAPTARRIGKNSTRYWMSSAIRWRSSAPRPVFTSGRNCHRTIPSLPANCLRHRT